MPARFTLEKRTNLKGESPIRLSWNFGGQRYQTTIGFSVKKEDWENVKLIDNDDNLGHTLRRINAVVGGLENHFKTHKDDLNKIMMKQAISDILSGDIARPEDAIERCIEGTPALPKTQTRYYRDRQGRYYRFICDAVYSHIKVNVLQELFGRQQRIALPESSFQAIKTTITRWPTADFKEVSYEEVVGKK